MEAKELRIGNYLLDRAERLCEVETVAKHNFFSAPAIRGGLTSLPHIPILLTEEWLIKFGFENWGNVVLNEHENFDRWVLHNVIGGTSNYEVHIIKSNYGNSPHTEICFSIDKDERQMLFETEFVHNLQNHFYAATNTELEIK